jgi:hypothetical protein
MEGAMNKVEISDELMEILVNRLKVWIKEKRFQKCHMEFIPLDKLILAALNPSEEEEGRIIRTYCKNCGAWWDEGGIRCQNCGLIGNVFSRYE